MEAMRELQFAELRRENFALSIEVGYRLLSALDDGEEKANSVLLTVSHIWTIVSRNRRRNC